MGGIRTPANVVLGPDVDLRLIAGRTPGFVDADLTNIINEAMLCAVRKRKLACAGGKKIGFATQRAPDAGDNELVIHFGEPAMTLMSTRVTCAFR
jgi:SpoVK/Ycf46/Vps4 family AAA+-type ATPase